LALAALAALAAPRRRGAVDAVRGELV